MIRSLNINIECRSGVTHYDISSIHNIKGRVTPDINFITIEILAVCKCPSNRQISTIIVDNSTKNNNKKE